jgi:hypothetical protein
MTTDKKHSTESTTDEQVLFMRSSLSGAGVVFDARLSRNDPSGIAGYLMLLEYVINSNVSGAWSRMERN